MINQTAQIHDSCQIGEFCVIGENVVIGVGCQIGHHVVIHSDSVIGNNVRIDDFACVGKLPMKAVNSAVTKECELSPANIADNVIVGTHSVVYRSAKIGQACLLADFACVRENVVIGEKTIVGKGVTIENECFVGSMVKIQTNAYITAYSVIEDNCFIAPNVVTSNDNFAGRSKERFDQFKGVTVKKGGRIAVGAVILPGRIIAEDALVGAGSVVTKNVAAETVVVGNPATEYKKVPDNQLLKNQ